MSNMSNMINTPKSLNNGDSFRKIYSDLLHYGQESAPRGLKILEIENYEYILQPYDRFTSFIPRKMNLDYIKNEFLWYLNGDKFDDSICDHASMWKSLKNEDGSINSNYGQYIFGNPEIKACFNQFNNVIQQLRDDRESRRAAMSILRAEHLLSETPDTPCTYSLSFRIRDNKLNMTVRMRSQDAIFGMTNDAPAFSLIHEMMFQELRAVYPGLEYGTYTHSADSFHVYERHFDMIKELPDSEYVPINCPKILNAEEVRYLINGNYNKINEYEHYEFAKWVLQARNEK